jgi:DNA processing protein
MTDTSQRHLAIALNASNGLSRAAICRLAASPETWVEAGGANPELAHSLGLRQDSLRRALALLPRATEIAGKELDRARKTGARLITLFDSAYPAALRDLALPPPVLCCRGSLPEGPAVAIVGARRLDEYGREAASHFARSLAAAGITVVSGFARGVDAAAHTASLAAGGKTVAVLGCGLDYDYPRGHRRLRDSVAENGALVSEFPLGAAPRTWHFPVRNRVIAALAGATLVIQATLRSGSLITARHALDLGREIFAVPGRIFDELALGPNALIRDGATPALHPRDLLDGLPLGLEGERVALPPESAPPASLPGLPGHLLRELSKGQEAGPEALAEATGESLDQVLGALLELELSGHIRRLPGPAYRRNP